VVRRIGGASGGANQRVCVALWARLLRQRARAGLGRRDSVSRENGGIEPRGRSRSGLELDGALSEGYGCFFYRGVFRWDGKKGGESDEGRRTIVDD
jgi:hypothetical protein